MINNNQQDKPPERGWRERAACREVDDPELFFPTAESGPARASQIAAAKAVCARCPVRQACLDEALRRIPYGICGGLTEHERRRLRTNRTNSEPVGSTTSRSDEPRTRPDVGESAAVREVLVDGPGRWLSGRERARVGRALLAAGCPPRQVARVCGVTERSVARWATRTSTSTGASTATACRGVGSGLGRGARLPPDSPPDLHSTPLTPARDTSTGRDTSLDEHHQQQHPRQHPGQ